MFSLLNDELYKSYRYDDINDDNMVENSNKRK